MRVAWIVYGALAQATGGYIYDRLVIERLRGSGDEVSVVSLAPRPRSRALSAARAALWIARWGPDVVVGDELCFREIAAVFAVIPRRIARVLLVHHLGAWELPEGPRRSLTALAERAAMWASDAVIATSGTTAKRLGRGDVAVAPPGADRLPRRARCGSGRGVLRLVFVGSFIPRKRVLELLAAFERANEGRAELTLIGDPTRDPPYAARVLRALERSPELRAGVLVRGLVDDDALADALAEADALVLPSSLEGYGMVLTEAIHAGLPVIATRGGAVEEVVKDGAEALLCDGEEGLTQALRRFLGDEGVRSRMRAEAEARAPSLPAWDQTAAAVRGVLLRAARRDHRLARAEPPPPR